MTATLHSMDPSIRQVVLVGLMGVGKTTVGRRLAVALGRAWRDSDADLQAATGRTVRELRDEEGVDAMHAREAAQLLDALAAEGPTVVSAAASVVDVEDCRRALEAPGVAVVWLRADPVTLAERFGSDPHRPAYGDDPADFLADQAARRDPRFAAVADLVVDTDGLDPDEVVGRVIDGLGSIGP
jgi:shikimate kinase